MLSEVQREFLTSATRTMQVIVGALAMGVIMYLVVVLIISRSDQNNPPPETPIIAYIGVFAACGAIVLSAVVPGLVSGQIRQSIIRGNAPNTPTGKFADAELGDVAPLAGAYQTRLIIGAAILEGAAFLNLVAYMLEHRQLSLIVTVVLLASLLGRIPTVGRLTSWVEDELTTIERTRGTG